MSSPETDIVVLDEFDAQNCRESAERTAASMVSTCAHVPGRVACEACIRSMFEVYLRRLTYRFRRAGVGP